MNYVGDYNLSTTFHHRFTTVNGSGVPTTLGNSPSAQYYVDGGTTAFTAGLTLTADFNTVVGLNSLAVICTSSASGLTSGVNVSVVLAAGTVSAVSMVGYPIIEYSIWRRSALRPATAGRTLVVSTTGGASIDWANINNPGSTVDLSATTLFVVDSATDVTNNVGAVVTAVNTITPARVTAQGIDVGAIVTAVNTIMPARVTAQGIDIGAIVTVCNTVVPARVTAQGIDVGAIVTVCNTVVPANVTAASINVGAVVTACNTVVPANVTAMSASGLAALFLTNSGTTYAASVAGSPVKEIADNAGGTALTVTGIASGVWDRDATSNQVQGSFGQAIGDPAADATTLYQAVITDAAGTTIAADIISIKADATSIRAKVTALTFTVANQVDANIESVNATTVTGTGAAGNEWGP